MPLYERGGGEGEEEGKDDREGGREGWERGRERGERERVREGEREREDTTTPPSKVLFTSLSLSQSLSVFLPLSRTLLTFAFVLPRLVGIRAGRARFAIFNRIRVIHFPCIVFSRRAVVFVTAGQ